MANEERGAGMDSDLIEDPRAFKIAEMRLELARKYAPYTLKPLNWAIRTGRRPMMDLPRGSRVVWGIAATFAAVAAGISGCGVGDMNDDPGTDNLGPNPGPSGSAGAGGEPPNPDKWGKIEGALYGNPDFTLTTPATKPAFDQLGTEYRDTGQVQLDGQTFTIFPVDLGGDLSNLQFAKGSVANPEDAMASPTADFVEGLEAYGQIYNIACYKNKIIFDSLGPLRLATLSVVDGKLTATDVIELPFQSNEITILVVDGVPYLYYKDGSYTGRVPLEDLPNIDNAEPFEALDGCDCSLPAEIIPPDPTTGEGLYFGEKNGIVFAAKKLSELAAGDAVVKELNGNPPAYFTGNVTATSVYNEAGQIIKVYVTFVRQQTEFGKRKLHYVVFSLAPKIDPPPDTDPVPDTDKPDAGSTVDAGPLDALEVVESGDLGDADAELPWELTEDVPPEDPGTPPEDPGTPPEDPGTPPEDPGATDPGATDPGATDPGATDPGAPDPGTPDPDAEPPDPDTETPDTAKPIPDTTNPDVKPDAEKPIPDAAKVDAETQQPDTEQPDTAQPTNENLFKFKVGQCNATVNLLEPAEAQKYAIEITGKGTEDAKCVAEVQIEGSDSVMLYTFWNDVDGEVKAKCTIVDKAGEAKPFCEILAINNLLDVVESGEGTQGKVLGTVTGSTASAWTIAYRQGVKEGDDGKPKIINYVEVRNNEDGTTVLMMLNESIILTLSETGVWYLIDAETGEEVSFFPEIPNPPEGAESLPIPVENSSELKPEAVNGAEIPIQTQNGGDPGCIAASVGDTIRAATSGSPAENQSRNLGTFLLLLATAATAVASRFIRVLKSAGKVQK